MKRINIIKEYTSKECRLFSNLSSIICKTDDDDLIIFDYLQYIREIMKVLRE